MGNQSEIGDAAFGRGMAAITTTSAGIVWFGWGFSALRSFSVAMLVAYLSLAAVLMAFAVKAVLPGRKMMKAQGVSRSDFWKKRRKAFGIVAVLEVVGCIIVLALVGEFRRPDWTAAGVSLVVGLHFLPLARIFESAAYYWVGSLMVAWDIVTVTVLKSWNPTVSAGIAGAILWAAAIHTLMRSFWVASPERSF
jgi:hypothetical protein